MIVVPTQWPVVLPWLTTVTHHDPAVVAARPDAVEIGA